MKRVTTICEASWEDLEGATVNVARSDHTGILRTFLHFGDDLTVWTNLDADMVAVQLRKLAAECDRQWENHSHTLDLAGEPF